MQPVRAIVVLLNAPYLRDVVHQHVLHAALESDRGGRTAGAGALELNGDDA